MDWIHVSLVLAVSTAWATVFLGALPVATLRLHAGEVLRACGAWIAVGLTSPATIRHAYFILAIICLASWIYFRRDRALAGKAWLSVASALGASLGIIFFLQAAPGVCPVGLPGREYLLLLASIYLGGAVTGLAYVGSRLSRLAGSSPPSPGQTRTLIGLVIFWLVVVGLELSGRMTRVHPLVDPRILLAALSLLAGLSLLTFQAVRAHASVRAAGLGAITALLALGTQFFARLDLL